MAHTRSTAIRAAVLAVAVCAVAGAQDFDSIFAPLADARSPGFAVLVRKEGRTVFERGYGVRDLRSYAKIDGATDFRLASFTKQFTATAIMLLIHDGKLRYDERITDLFPDFPAYGRRITIRQLLTHTSGLPDYEELMGAEWTVARQIQDDEVLGLLERQTRPKFAPGTSWAYSNSGYVVLGLIVAKASGEPLWKFMHDRIFAPLHMDGTVMFVNGKNKVPNRAYGHTKRDGGFVETDQSATSGTLGDGGIYSNLEDLAKWDAALEEHTLLGKNEARAALIPVKLNDGSQPKWPAVPGDAEPRLIARDNLHPGKPVSYGFGWFLDSYQGRTRMWHSGSTEGFRTVIDRFTGEKLTVVILCNRTDVDPSELALRVVDVLWKR